MKIKEFSKYLEKLEKITSRNKMTEILSELYKILTPEEALYGSYLLLGELGPPYRKIDFNIAEKMLIKIIAFAFEKTELETKNIYKKTGDLGETGFILAEKLKLKGENLELLKVYFELKKIAEVSGEGSVEKKITLFSSLLKKLDPLSLKYILRIPISRLRLGFQEATIIDALSFMEKGDKSLKKDIETAFNLSCDIGLIAKIFKEKGALGIKKIKITPGIPIRMSAAERLESEKKIIEKLGKCFIEPKYDGFRVQIHKFRENKKSVIKIFSRNLEDVTEMFPDVKKNVEVLPFESIIFEGEAIGYDKKTGKFLPFQETIQRKRKYGIEKKAKEIPLKVYVFDLLYLEGREIWKMEYKKRRSIMEKIFSKDKKEDIVLTESVLVDSPDEIHNLFMKYIKLQLEGVLAKKIDAIYEAGKRSFHWVKFKKATEGKLMDTFDLVIMGYYYGRGKRSSFGIGAFLAGTYDKQNNKFLTVAKIGTGLTDEEWKNLKLELDKIKTKKIPKNYKISKELLPDVFVEPRIVVEIGADEITKSPVHTSFIEKLGYPLGLRFPRVVRFRTDKAPYQATTLEELYNIYKQEISK